MNPSLFVRGNSSKAVAFDGSFPSQQAQPFANLPEPAVSFNEAIAIILMRVFRAGEFEPLNLLRACDDHALQEVQNPFAPLHAQQ